MEFLVRWNNTSLISLKKIISLKTFIGVQLLCNIVLVPTVQQSESAIHIHTYVTSFLDFLPI